jgi:predicted enzyme involved in methoxymalonyl-ACP biosynthesis
MPVEAADQSRPPGELPGMGNDEQTRATADLTIAILRNYSVEAMVPLLKVEAALANLAVSVTVGGYDTVRQEILDPHSLLGTAPPDIVVLSLALDYLAPDSLSGQWDPAPATDFVVGALSDLIERTAATIVVNTFPVPLYVENPLAAASGAAHRATGVSALARRRRSTCASGTCTAPRSAARSCRNTPGRS